MPSAPTRAQPNQRTPEQKLGVGIRKLRKEAGYSQEKLAEIADISRYYVYILETGEKSPTLATLVAVARSFGLKPSELLDQVEL